MPDNDQENKDPIVGDTPELERSSEEKRRIKPVIEEVSSSIPAMNEISTDKEEKEMEHQAHEEKEREVHQSEDLPHTPSTNLDKDEQKSDIKLFVVIAILTAVVVAALAGGVYVYLTGTKNLGSSETQTPAPEVLVDSSPEPTPESSPLGETKLDSYKVQILNGSGKIGEAGKAKTLIEKAGFKVANTGNAKSFDFTDTLISVKSDVSSEALEAMKESLSSTYSVKSGEDLDSDSDYDIVITLGSK